MHLMAEITVEVAFSEFIDDKLDDAQAKQRVSKRLFAEHSMSQIEMSLVTPATVM